MASYTPNLNLLKKDPVADGNDFFNIKTMMNDNWDKIDAKVKAALDDIGDLQSEQVRIATGSYVGTGTYGASNPCSLTFDFVPIFLFVRSSEEGDPVSGFIAMQGVNSTYIFWGSEYTEPTIHLIWEDENVSWYNASNQWEQMNAKNIPYRYVVIG